MIASLVTSKRRSRSDADLIEACRRGHGDAWEILIDRYSRLVYSIPRRYGLDGPDSEDVHQATFVALHRSIDRIEDPERLAAWLCTTAHREAWRIGKRSGRTVELLEERVVDVGEPDQQDAIRWERQYIVREALERLGGPCQSLLESLFREERPDYRGIADELGIAIGSIGPTRARCFRKLRPILEGLGLTPEEVAETH